MNTQSLLAEQLKNKEYRDAFVASQLRIGLPMQCRALRESREWTQPKLADIAGWSQPRISELERPGERKPNIETLLRLASAFDVALQIRFVPFSQLVDDDDSLDLDSFRVAPFLEDMEHLKRIEEQMNSPKHLAFDRMSGIRAALIGRDQSTNGNSLTEDFKKTVQPEDPEARPQMKMEDTSGANFSGIAC